MAEVREDVVDALVAAHLSGNAVFELAALDFEVAPPPTDSEREEAKRRVLRSKGEGAGGVDA